MATTMMRLRNSSGYPLRAFRFITALSSIWPEAVEEPIRSLLIIGITGSLGLLNIRGVQIFKYLNNFVTLAKLIPLLLFVFMGIFYVQREHFTPLNWHELEFESFGAAALVIFYAFGGFETLVVVAEEMKNPQKNLPLAVMVVIAFCSLLYLVIQFIAIGILGKDLAHSITPLADAAQLFLGETGKFLITIIMLISIGGVNLACSFITPRSGVVLAEDGFIPQWISTKGRFGSPVWAIIVTVVFTALFSFSGSFGQLIVVSVVSRFAQYISTCIAVYVLHRRLAIQKKTHLKSTYIIIPSIALIGVGWLLLQASMYQLVLGLGALLIGIPIYWIQKYAEKESKVLPDPIPSLNVEKSNLSPLNDF